MNHILVPINLRSDLQNLLKYAESVSIKSQSRITLFYAGGRKILHGSGNYQFDCESELEDFIQQVRKLGMKQRIEQTCLSLDAQNIKYTFKFVSGRSINEVIRETTQNPYDLVIMATHSERGLRGYYQDALASRVIAEVSTPVFLVPAKSSFNEIEHITYAVDLTEYDPNIIRQVKAIAGLFDASLSITHVNRVGESEQEKAQYVSSLERTISDTLDYPKVYYKFFDHADPMGGIVKFVKNNDCNLIAMINRKKFSWRDLFRGDKSMTRRMPHKVSVPILAFNKYSVS